MGGVGWSVVRGVNCGWGRVGVVDGGNCGWGRVGVVDGVNCGCGTMECGGVRWVT